MSGSTAGLPVGTRVVLDSRTRVWQRGAVLAGGSPWGLVRLAAPAHGFVRRLRAAGRAGTVPAGPVDQAVADRLVERGLAHPLPEPRRPDRPPAVEPPAVEVVVPVFDRPELLRACLLSLRGVPTVVVDDASTDDRVAAVAVELGARLLRHPVNQGPAAARNTGLAATTAPVVAFVDADCVVSPGWLDLLLPLFDDPRVGAAAPRVSPRMTSRSWLARHEQARSALDMGARPELVRWGGALGFLPSAALLVRREALAGQGFDPQLRLGEDVDLVWRLAKAGWHVRYEPRAEVRHELRLEPRAWAVRRFEYGTSAAVLDRRHPGRLAPVRASGWNVAAGALLLSGRPRSAAAVAIGASAALGLRLRRTGVTPVLAAAVVGQGFVADGVAVGHALRREWWPLGAAALLASPRSRSARAAALCMLGPIGFEWWRNRPDVDPARYVVLRLVEDAAYGTGVILSAVRERRPSVLLPRVRLPKLRILRSPTLPRRRPG